MSPSAWGVTGRLCFLAGREQSCNVIATRRAVRSEQRRKRGEMRPAEQIHHLRVRTVTESMVNRGDKIAHVHGAVLRLGAELIAGAVDLAAANAAAREYG